MKTIILSVLILISPLISASDSSSPEVYTAEPGTSLSATLIKWSSKNSFNVLWNVKSESGDTIDWEISHPVRIEANYYDAVSTLLRAYRNTNRKIKFSWTFYKNNVLEIHLEESL